MISAHKINFRGYSSADFNLYTCFSFESDDGELNTYLTREGVASEHYRGEFKRTYCYKYTETFAPKFTFTKVGFEEFTPKEVRNVLSWITGNPNASFLSVYKDDSDVISFEILGGFTEVSLYKLSNSRVVGIVATFESLSPYAFSPLKIHTTPTNVDGVISITEPTRLEITCDSDEPEMLIYPKITITEGNSVVVKAPKPMTNQSDHTSGTVYEYDNIYYWIDSDGTLWAEATNSSNFDTTSVVIENTTTGTKMIIGGNKADEVITLDGANRVISSTHTRIFGDTFNWQWLPLQKGINEVNIIGNCTIKFEWREPIKCGEM